MNIFVLNEDPVLAAQEQCDKHVVKMVLETAQMLSIAHRVDDNATFEYLYKVTHLNHPCVKWVLQSKANYEWLYKHFVGLCDEYTKRYNKVHLSDKKLRDFLKNSPSNLPNLGLTPFPQAMPDEYRKKNPVEAYRTYYIKDKSYFAKWKSGNVPSWFTKEEVAWG